ncbi:transcriptional regulator [Salsuginibacillus halophilus]|uniref:Transcriptional regulator n=1 Tax=Salsuginibacillus halophilus TaxID=517424 RepID=A0A2P8H9T0_9BACI|nr:sigma 54-interacting transcriptional regulator [Salsuginibacillus halophilus]PSL42929.1 transcriptional regulator [Salsuginibacillus halophilus]
MPAFLSSEAPHDVNVAVKHWMKTPHIFTCERHTLGQLIELLTYSEGEDLIAINRHYEVEGVLKQQTVLELQLAETALNTRAEPSWLTPVPALHAEDAIVEVQAETFAYPVVNDEGKLVGTLPPARLAEAAIAFSVQNKHQSDIVNVVLESAYEGIAVVDADARIQKLNEAYRSFLGIAPEEVVEGRLVTEVIENTRLHHTVATGVPERGQLQVMQGQNMVVHRIPIWRNQELVGAIGMLIFEGVRELYHILEHAREVQGSSEPHVKSQMAEPVTTYSFEQMIGESRALQYCKSRARKAARTQVTVLLTGESGTGKEVFAQSIHGLSERRHAPFMSINCAAIPEQLLEAELFGYEEGAFTGAKKGGQAGKFEAASGGTVFLDEIGEMPLSMQAKLLRVLEENHVTRVGGRRTIPVDVRLVAATNQNLAEQVRTGRFRRDLYYRLCVVPIELPPLRERRDDIPELVQHYAKVLADKHGVEAKAFSKEAMAQLMQHSWPGNVRELINVLEQALIMTEAEIVVLKHLPALEGPAPTAPTDVDAPEDEKARIEAALAEAGGNKAKAARLLGMHRTTLYKKIETLNV